VARAERSVDAGPMNGFGGRHVLITGASSGIGLVSATLLARRGARVYLVARRRDQLAAAASAIAKEGGIAAYGVADVSDRDALLAAIAQAEAAFGPIEAVFANAGTGGRFTALTAYDEGTFDQVIRTNLTSVFWTLKRVLPGMLERRRGSILMTGSISSERGMANNVAYVASKHGLLGLARAAALEAAPYNVRVNCVIPGLIETPMLLQIDPNAPLQQVRELLGRAVPMGRIGTAEELAETACFLLSDAASHVTAQAIAVDGGMLGTFKTR